jgi:arginase
VGAETALLGVPTSAGAHWPGQERGPEALRLAGLVESLAEFGELHDHGDLRQETYRPDTEQPQAQSVARVASVVRAVADAVEGPARASHRLVVIGGDCTIELGVAAGFRRLRSRDELGLIYLDGHLDLNTPLTSGSGILDSMGLAHMLGHGVAELTTLAGAAPILDEERVALFGYNLEEASVAEREALKWRRSLRYPLDAIRPAPIEAAVATVQAMSARASGYLVHFDVDVIDFTDFPAADVPQFSPGLPFGAALSCLGVFLADPACLALTITEFNPDRDLDGSLARRLVTGLARAFDRRS